MNSEYSKEKYYTILKSKHTKMTCQLLTLVHFGLVAYRMKVITKNRESRGTICGILDTAIK